ncbi:hydrogenase maturation nickel metallochaperone HypA [Sulfurimonas sediminis]|uniref:Hydrogenase maturation factor HypA n=1 Tax=Sulfurimonas sediminis TaxID=2590020 RepID=A0A7M1B0T5_9BACT|nr:hydrogenase maturation nickel metallochaperone HypA [Sulfurimonas sediminis]QOP43377.1 hydrogenase maturation nickel metallochaperone HypA [Sulfurimonas sediminis]
MHEYSIVQSMLDLCEKHSKGQEVAKVAVKIGKMSGIEPHFLKESFEVFKEGTVCQDATMDMQIIEITIECQKCKKVAVVDSFNFYCPYCQGGDTKVLTGQEMHIDYIELKEV